MGKVIDFFINNIRLNYVLFTFLVIAGIFSYKSLPKEIFPPIVLNEIIISGGYGGSSANILDKMAVQNIEDEISNISGISKITSKINSNYFKIKVELENKDDKDEILRQVKDAISKIKKDLPTDMSEPSANINIGKFPLIIVNISSNTSSHDKIIDVAKELKSRFSNVKNLSNIHIYGEGKKQVKIKIDLNILKAYGVNPSSVLGAISNSSSIFPIGKIAQKKDKNYFISTYNGEKSVKELLELSIKVDGKILKLKDFAKITKSYQNDQTISLFDNKYAVSINISKTKNGNAMELVKEIKNIISVFQTRYPNITFGTFSDTSVYIQNRLNTIVSNIILGLILVGLSLYILINKRIAFVVILGIPTSFIICSIIFKIFGLSVNMVSLLGALIALGVIVDDAIIVAENIQRHIENGEDVKQAALIGTKEVLFPVLASSLTTIFAFLPMLVMSNEMGEFIKVIPISISVLIVSSVLESFIFLPLHSKHVLKAHEKEISWQPFIKLYEMTIRLFIYFKKTSIVLFYVLVPLVIYVSIEVSKFQLFPSFDGDQINIDAILPIDTTLKETEQVVKKINDILLTNKKKYFIQNITSMAGFRMDPSGKDSGIADNFFHIFVDLKKPVPQNFVSKYITPYLSFDYDDSNRVRTKSSYELEQEIYKDLGDIKNSYNFTRFDVKGPRAGIADIPIQLYFYTNDNVKANRILKQMKDIFKSTNKIQNINDNAHLGIDEIKLKINKYGQMLGINEQIIAKNLSGYFLGSFIAKGFDENGMFNIVVEEKNKNSLSSLKHFPILLSDGKKVLLNDIVDFVIVKNYATIYKKTGKRKWEFSCDVKPKENANDILESITEKLQILQEKEQIKIDFGGEEEKNKQLLKEISIAALIALFLIFMTLLILFDSFRLTFMILSVIPFSILGVFIGHFIMQLNLSMPSIIGSLGLAGVVINDGILMLDFIKNSTNLDELLSRAKLRLRPIFLTSITTLIGLSTLIFFPSGQALIMQPLAVSLGFGLFWGTFLNLVYLPTLFALVYKIKP